MVESLCSRLHRFLTTNFLSFEYGGTRFAQSLFVFRGSCLGGSNVGSSFLDGTFRPTVTLFEDCR
jgi:hypothetical protein